MHGRYVHPEAGNTVRYLLKQSSRKAPDPRKNIIIDVGLLLGSGGPINLGETIVLDRVDVTDPEYTIFIVRENDLTVFEALVSSEEVEIGTYKPGAWEGALHAVAGILRSHSTFTLR
jgi:hypothetical protein